MTPSRTAPRGTMIGVSIANALVPGYGLFRPDSLAFSIPFLVAPSLILLWSEMRGAGQAERQRAIWVTIGVVTLALVATFAAMLRS